MKIFRNKLESLQSKIHTTILASKSNIQLGLGTSVYRKSLITYINGGRVKIGDNVLLGRSEKNYHVAMPFYTTLFVDRPQATISIGDNCRINGAYIHSQTCIEIGSNCVVASGVNIIDSNGHQLISKNRTIGRDEPKPIKIGDNVWIGLNVTILKGTTIGDNCVIAAGSVIKGYFPANALIQGNPAKFVSILPIEE